VDNWKPAVDTHRENHPESNTILDDVIRLSKLPDKEFEEIIPDSEIIIGSPPCIAFSNSNRSGKGDKTKGIELFEAFLRIIFRKKNKKDSILKYWILENVPNLKNHIQNEYTAKELGIKSNYSLKVSNGNAELYNAKYYGVPSNRKRFFCGEFPSPKKTIESDNELIHLSVILDSLGMPKKNMELIITDSNYPTFSMKSKDITDHHYIREIAEHEWKKAKRLKQDKGYMGRMSFPENIDKPSRTIMATISYSARESMIFNFKRNQFRAPTIREVASLMSFPIDYRFYGKSKNMKYKLVGNSVPPKLSYAFAKAIAEKENLNYNTIYEPINHPDNIDFQNLNCNIFYLNEEKPKKNTSKFKHHIPYLIIDTFRVELTNNESDFENLRFKWDVEIHKSQGPKAKIFKPRQNIRLFTESEIRSMEDYCSSTKDRLVNYNKFQKIHCMTTKQREKDNLLGPYELLSEIKHFIESQGIDSKKTIIINYQGAKLQIPYKILFAYYALKLIINN
ncbi:MAG: DNA cytosine methyltransferase, partial [Clostridiales bacterium]|nr:DNA cytosine methyltransferase [Clostridiales bacterium]